MPTTGESTPSTPEKKTFTIFRKGKKCGELQATTKQLALKVYARSRSVNISNYKAKEKEIN